MSRPQPVTSVRALKVRPDRAVELPEHVATEEPLQVLVAGPSETPVPLAVTMRTPGSDFELAAGFVVSEGVAGPGDIRSVDYCEARDEDPAARWNSVAVRLARPVSPEVLPTRGFAVSASCGICGAATLDQVDKRCLPLADSPPFPGALIPSLPDVLRQAQKAFDRTGGLHAAGLFAGDGTLVCAREDVGRHNAVDKVIGWSVLRGPAPPGAALVVSGRVSFEIVQKAAMGGLGVIAAVSAPSSLALAAADRLGVAVVAFVRGQTFNVYTHPERIGL